MHKPYGYISQFITDNRRKKLLLGGLYNFAEGTMAIGRLDEKSEGLLLLTTDGKMSELIRSSKFEKEYYAQLDGLITDEAVRKLEEGVEIGFEGKKYITKKCKVKKITSPKFPERTKKIRDERHGPTSWVSIILEEGKFRQVRKMTATVGFPTLRLIRVRIGKIQLGDLKPGEVKELDSFSS